MPRKKQKQRCLTCQAEAAIRGVCRACYTTLYRAIDRGEITETYAICHDMILPQAKPGPKATTGMAAKINEVKDEASDGR